MSNPNRLSARHSFELLAKLRETVSDYTRREEALVREINSRRYHLQKSHREVLHQADTKLSTKLNAADAITHKEEERIREIYNKRRALIQKIHHADLGDVQLNARRAKEKFLSELQLRHFNAKRNLPLELEAAEVAYAQFSGRLKDQRSAYERAERSALDAFAGYSAFKNLLRREPHPPSDAASFPEALLKQIQEQLNTAGDRLKEFRALPIPALFRGIPLPGWIVVIIASCALLAFILRHNSASFAIAGATAAALIITIFALHAFGKRQAMPAAVKVADALAVAARLHDECRAAATAKHATDRQAVQNHYDETKADIDAQWKRADQIEDDYAHNAEEKFEVHIPRALATADRILTARLDRVRAEGNARRSVHEQEGATQRATLTAQQEKELQELNADAAAKWTELTSGWTKDTNALYEELRQMQAAIEQSSPALDKQLAETWAPSNHFTPASRFANLAVDLSTIAPKDERLRLPGPAKFSIPLALTFPEQGSLLFDTNDSGNPAVIGTLNLLILRLLATMPPGKVSFTILDPVGLGQNFAGLMHLSDYEENLINRKIWTQRDQIDERLSELNEHIEKVIQMYLRNEFQTISDYNAQAGSVAEKYHFLVIADFPANFGETAAKRLQSIVSSGPRCGVFTLMHWDKRQEAPEGLVPDELRKNGVCLKAEGGTYIADPIQLKAEAALILDPAPEAALAAELVHKIGQASIDSNRVEVPFTQIAPPPPERWTGETTQEIRVPIGRTGAVKHQYLAIGKGTRQHALFAGKTGSGKSTLFHVIITNLALWCSPDEIEFYLIDFKKGVEFKCYASKRLPHARVVAIESDREFGLSVLQRVDEELKRRGDIFRKMGVQDIPGYKKAGGKDPMPRCMLIIDEFQEFFVEDDTIAQTASMLFDRIVRQGRAFGIHVLLGSQTLGGAYTLARATLGQMVIRVALQCNEADAYLIMDENNSAPRLLSRPGEGIYNDAAGAVEGNSPFQVVWLPDDEREHWLDEVSTLAEKSGRRFGSPIVFEGNAPADIRENDQLAHTLDTAPAKAPVAARSWIGAPNSIKGPTEALFHRQSGNNLLIVGQREEAALTMLGLSLVALAAQYPVGSAKFIFLHASVPGSADAQFIEHLTAVIPHGVTAVSGHEVTDVMTQLSADLKARTEGEAASAPEVFVFIHGLPRFKKLRYEDDFSFGDSGGGSSGAQLNEIINEGASLGIHLLVTVDTFSNVNRFINRKAMAEFEMRVVFQMSANDSASLIDSPKASTLGLHRALFYNETLGVMETFRPYATPEPDWFAEAAKKLSARKTP